MEVDSVLVTGANRGIGLELVKQLVNLSKPPRLVFATYRNKDTIKALSDIRDASKETRVTLIKMDVTNADDIESSKKIVDDMVGEKGLTLLVNNAGAHKRQAFPEATDENLLFHFTSNTLGPIKVLKAMLPLLQRSADANRELKVGVSRGAVLNISSRWGSVGNLVVNHPSLGSMGYSISKTALNMAMRVVAVQTHDKGVLVVQMCPGWVKTDMGTNQAYMEYLERSGYFGNPPLDVVESVSSILDSLTRLDESHHGGFVDNKGVTIPF